MPSYNLVFPQNTVSLRKERQVAEMTITPGHFEGLSSKRLAAVSEKLLLQAGQVLSIRNQYVQQHVMRSTGRVRGRISQLGSSPGADEILRFSRKYNYPPVLVYKMVYGKADTFCDQKILRQLEDHDVFFRQSRQEQSARDAAAFEVSVVEAFRHAGVDASHIRTQEELVEEQREKYGRPVATPDLLFRHPVQVNGRKIMWVDAKNFYACDLPFVRRSLEEQAAKYNKHFGPGAFMFRYGFSEKYRDSEGVMHLSP
jgi:hypothetical protein